MIKDPDNPEAIEDAEFQTYRKIVDQLTEDIDFLTSLRNFDYYPELEKDIDFAGDAEKEGNGEL